MIITPGSDTRDETQNFELMNWDGTLMVLEWRGCTLLGEGGQHVNST